MEVRLVVASGKNAGQKVSVKGQRFFIGRAEDCNLRPNTDLISRHHCVITVEDGFVTIRDLGSRNGTFVNEERIRGEEELNDGDKIAIGPLKFDIEFAVDTAEQNKEQNTQEAANLTTESPHDVDDDDGDGIDLSDWLGSDPDESHDTRSSDQATAATITFSQDQDTTSTSAVHADANQSTEEDQKTRKDGAKKPGRLPRDFNKTKTADSQAAAADTLRHFFHRR